jgi:hypothetical protein
LSFYVAFFYFSLPRFECTIPFRYPPLAQLVFLIEP